MCVCVCHDRACNNAMTLRHLLYSHFLECSLQKFPVLDVLVFLFSGKLDPFHSYCAWEQHVEELAVSSTWMIGGREGGGGREVEGGEGNKGEEREGREGRIMEE